MSYFKSTTAKLTISPKTITLAEIENKKLLLVFEAYLSIWQVQQQIQPKTLTEKIEKHHKMTSTNSDNTI